MQQSSPAPSTDNTSVRSRPPYLAAGHHAVVWRLARVLADIARTQAEREAKR